MAEITSLGAGSGLDLSGLVDQLVTLERQSRSSRLNVNESRVQNQLSGFGQITGAASSFQDTLEPLEDLAAYRGRAATTEEDGVFTATATAEAATGRYAIEVVSLAQAQKVRTDAFDSSIESIGTGTITISTGAEAFSVTLDEEGGSLADIRDAINASAENSSVTAGIVNSVDGAHLILTGTDSGEDAAFSVAVAGGDGGLESLAFVAGGGASAFSEVNAAADAQLRIDGLEVSASSNIVNDAIEGVTINLLAAEEGTIQEVTISFDREAAKEQINTFVQGYNNLLQTVGNQTSFNPETFQSGALFGDSAVRSLVSDVRGVVNSLGTDPNVAIRSLAQIGITTELDGSLSIDDALLDDAMNTNFEEVGLLFAGEEGLSARLNTVLGGYLDSTGRLTTRTDSLESRVEDLATQREALELRMESFEARIRRQFTGLDSLISELNNTSTFLTQQLDGLPGFGNN